MDWLVRDGEWDNAEIGVPHLDQHVQRQSGKEKHIGLGLRVRTGRDSGL